MAFIGKIRSNMWVVFVIIALATLSFILMDAQGPGGGAVTDTTLGVINGKKIDYRDFDMTERVLFSNNSQDPLMRRAGLWDYYVNKTLVREEADALGMDVSKNELIELQFGQSLSPIIFQNYRTQSGQVDIAQLTQIKNAIQSNSPDLTPDFRRYWAEQEKQVISTQLQTKLNNIVQKGIYTPTWLAEENYKLQNSSVDLEVVKIPFADIPANDITVSDADLTSYIKDHSYDFDRKEEERALKYVVLDVNPNKQDSIYWRGEMDKLITGFKTTNNDSLYAFQNGGGYGNYYMRSEELPEDVRNVASSLSVGEVYGPYIVQRSLQSAKLLDKAVIPDSVNASHILINVTQGNVTELERANSLIDSLMGAARRGASFSDLASEFSDDTSNKANGGSLGTFIQGAMVPAFNEVCFLTGREGGLYKVKTQFGVHLLKINDKIFNSRAPKYKMAFINIPIIPTKKTQDDFYDIMVDLVGEYSYLDGLEEKVNATANLEMVETEGLKANDYSINLLGPGNVTRDMIRFAYDGGTSVGDLSPQVFTYTDDALYYNKRYVAVGLSKIMEPGLAKASDVRSQIETTVMNMKKGAAYAKGLAGQSLAAVAGSAGVEMDTILNAAMSSIFVPGIGNEPKVMGTASQLAEGASSGAIVGNSGVFMIKKIKENKASDPAALDYLKTSLSAEARRGKEFKLIEAIKKKSNIKDNRATFF